MAIIMPFMVTSFAWTLPDFRWRHMFGVPSFCCGLSSTLNTNMVLASIVCLISIATVGVALILFVRGIPAMQVTRVISGAIMVIGVSRLFKYKQMLEVDIELKMLEKDFLKQ